MEMIKNADNVYVIISSITNTPYVVCDKETYDDMILVYLEEDDAKKKGEELLKAGYPVQVMVVDKKHRFSFLLGLYFYGINALSIGSEIVQLKDIVKMPSASEVSSDRVRVENPEFHLTALYFMQELRRANAGKIAEEVMELQEEMIAHFAKGKFIIPVVEGKGIPIMKTKTGEKFHPIFTDAYEYEKFAKVNSNTTFKSLVVESEKMGEVFVKEADGVVVNPLGVNVQVKLQVK